MFSTQFSNDKKAFKKVKQFVEDFTHHLSSRIAIWELSPLIRLLDYKTSIKYENIFNDYIQTIKDLYKHRVKVFENSVVNCICDKLIEAKNNAKDSAIHITDENLSLCLSDLILGGVDTTGNIFLWALLYMTYYPDIQRKLRQEISDLIGDRMPTHEDSNRCNYVMAFIEETLRLRNILPIGGPHKTMSQCRICNLSFTL